MKKLRDIFPGIPISEDMGVGAIGGGGGGQLTTQAVQSFDPVMTAKPLRRKKLKCINKTK
jgi:hypothetical protein